MGYSANLKHQPDGIKILYIDDDPLALKSLSVLLQTLGYEVDSADDAATGLEWFRANSYDLVITDMNMPGMNGIGLTKEVKQISPSTPVIVISGNIEINSGDAMESLMPDCVLVKPLNFEAFSFQLDRLLHHDRSTDQE